MGKNVYIRNLEKNDVAAIVGGRRASEEVDGHSVHADLGEAVG